MQAGNLRHLVLVQTATITKDNYGGETQVWNAGTSVRASVEPLQGREYYAAQQMQTEVTTRIRMRKVMEITPANRIVHGADVYDIKSVIDPGKYGREQVIMCALKASDQ